MRECPQCLASIQDDAQQACPVCGGAPQGMDSDKGDRSESAPADITQDSLWFRRQFEERKVFVPEESLARAETLLAQAETELRRATVLIADLSGFSRVGQSISPEDLSSLAREFYETCVNCVLRRSGFVVKFIGDAAMAVFGAPVAFDRDTEAAVRAALDIRESWAQHPKRSETLNVRIGLATGALQCGPIESPSGRTFDVIGGTVNLAARLQQAGKVNEILICETTYNAVSRWFDAEPTEPLQLPNISDHYIAYSVKSEKGDARLGRVFDTPFCGREKEIQFLSEHFKKGDSRGVKIVHVAGEAGIGKSRLLDEALVRNGLKETSIVWEGTPAHSSVLLWPVIHWLSELLDLSASESAQSMQARIRGNLLGVVDEKDADPVLIEYLLGVPEALDALRGVPPERIQRNLFGLLVEVLRGALRDAEIPVLVVDDLQWVDPLTAQFLLALIEWPELQDLRLIFACRSGAKESLPPALGRFASSRVFTPAPEDPALNLQPMEPEDRSLLIERVTPVEDFLPEIRRVVLERAGGNPLFLEEMTRLVKQVIDKNAILNGEALVNHIVDVIPVSLRDLIQSRIDRLDSRNRQVLQCASLLGLEFSFTLIDMFESIREGLSEHLQALRALQYLEELSVDSGTHYLFTHGLFRDVAYSTLLEEQKKRLHLSLALRLEEAFSNRLLEYCETLAFHFSRGGNTDKAVYYLIKSAGRQASLGASSLACENYIEALELLRGSHPSPTRQILMARTLVMFGRLQRISGDGDEADDSFAASLDLARSLGNKHLALEAELEQAISLVWKTKSDEARSRLEALARDASMLGNANAEVVALNSLGVLQFQTANHESALRSFQDLAVMAEKRQTPQVQADAFNNAGLIYWRWGQLPQALKAYKRALALRRKASDKFGLCATLMNVGIVQEQMGEIRAARSSYRKAREMAEKTGYVQGLAAIESNLSNLERRIGAAAPALDHALQAVEHARQAGDPVRESIAEHNAGLARMALGQISDAREHLRNALDLGSKSKAEEQLIDARITLIELDAREDKLQPAHIDEINEIIRGIESRKLADLAPRAYRAKATILEALNEANEKTAKEYFDMACDKTRESGAFFEELESWRALRQFAARKSDEETLKRCAEKITGMEKMLGQ